MKNVNTTLAPSAIGPYSQAKIAGQIIYTSGQIPLNPASGVIEQTTIEGQTHQAIANLAAILKEAGSDLSKVIKTTCFLQHMSDFAAFNAIYAEYFPQKPARSCVEVGALPKNALLEIEAIAEL